MNIQEYIQHNLPVFEVSEPLKNVISFFADSHYSHIAVKENDVFLGLLSVNDLPSFEPDGQIEALRYQLEHFYVTTNTLWLDVLEKFARNETNILPVVDEESLKISGYYDITDVMAHFIDTPFFKEPGGILVVSKGIKDYALSEICQIVESNNGKLLGALITDSQNDMIQVTLKIGNANLNEVIQTFRRYSYSIMFGNNDDQFLEDLKERSAYLTKYLNV